MNLTDSRRLSFFQIMAILKSYHYDYYETLSQRILEMLPTGSEASFWSWPTLSKPDYFNLFIKLDSPCIVYACDFFSNFG